MTRPRVLLADDHRLLREAFTRLLETDCEVVGAVADGRALLAAAPEVRPDIVVLDVAMPLLNGLDAARQLKRAMPHVKVIFLTMNEDPEVAAEAFRAGASGYLLKRTTSSELLDAIRDVQKGGSPMTAHIARKVVQSFQKAGPSQQATENLSQREQEVLDCLSQGFLYKEIADKLGISYETVHTYVRRIYEKLQVRTRTEAVAKFLRK